MVYFQQLVWPAAVALLISLIVDPSIVLATTQCNQTTVSDSELLVELALTCNAGQRAINERWQAQQYQAQSVGHLDDPKLMLGIAPQTFGQDNFDDGYIVELSQPLLWPGILALREKAALAESDIWQATQGEEQVRLARDVRVNLAMWQYHQMLITINQKHQALWRKFIAITRTKYVSGVTGKSALLQATHEQHLLLQEAIELKAAQTRDASELKRLANLSTTTVFTIKADMPITDLSANTYAELLALLDQQPVLKKLEAKQRHKNNQLKLIDKDRYPSFAAMARYNSLWMSDEQRWVVGVNMNLPLDFGKRTNHEASVRAEQIALQWEQQNVQVQLREQLIQAHSYWQQAKDTYQLYQQKLKPLSLDSLETARHEYQTGAGDFLSLLTAQRQLLATERKASMALRDQYAQFAKLIAAAGLVHNPAAKDNNHE